ncbi:hypothetical protein GCM10023156_48660 [Novipirellula rosea]|uniref:Small CPxCG-related zinc finger protein n=2 Tax=Novipirellula rosea TaxID=1031540 RepID=A0ABP8NCD3_9BACT
MMDTTTNTHSTIVPIVPVVFTATDERTRRLAWGMAADDDAERLLAMDEMDPTDVPTCPRCRRVCDTQRMDDDWRCSRCDTDAREIRERTRRFWAQ